MVRREQQRVLCRGQERVPRYGMGSPRHSPVNTHPTFSSSQLEPLKAKNNVSLWGVIIACGGLFLLGGGGLFRRAARSVCERSPSQTRTLLRLGCGQRGPACGALHLHLHPSSQTLVVKQVVAWGHHVVAVRHNHLCHANDAVHRPQGRCTGTQAHHTNTRVVDTHRHSSAQPQTATPAHG